MLATTKEITLLYAGKTLERREEPLDENLCDWSISRTPKQASCLALLCQWRSITHSEC